MTIVDDSLAGAVPVRGGKAGGKGAKHAETAAQNDAFNRAFSDAGKKQQPQVSIRDTADGDTTEPSSRISIQTMNTAKIGAATARETAEANAKQSGTQAPFEDSLQTEPEATSAKPKQPAHENGPFDRLNAVLEKLAQASAEEEAPIANTDIASKLADIFKGRKAELSEKLQGKEQAVSTPDQDDTVNAEPAAKPGDVDQLLAMLQASQAAQAAAEDAPQATSGLNEFQALADRAVKPKTDGAKAAPAVKGSEAAHAEAELPHNVEGGETDRVFRFARADGKGQPVSMKVGSDGDNTAIDTNTPAAKAETVTVVEARRYLGTAPVSSNAQAVTSAISGSSEWAQSIQQASAADASFQQATGKVVNTLKIQMHPIDLGMVTATLRLKDDELHVDLKVETGDAFRQLSDDQNAMVKALRAQGFAVDQVNIVFNAPDSNSGGSQQQQQFAPGGQNGREAQAGSGEGSRGQRQDGGNQQGERWTANDTTGDGSSSDTGRTGHVYM